MNAKLKALVWMAPLVLSGCLLDGQNQKPPATDVPDPLSESVEVEAGATAGALAPAGSAQQRKVNLSWSTEGRSPVVEIDVSAEACDEAARASGLTGLHLERGGSRQASSRSFCLSTGAVPGWSLVSEEPGGWHSLAGWAVPAGSATKVARLLFTGPQGKRQSVVASASLFCSGARGTRCMSVFSAHQGGVDTPASVPLNFAGRGLTQLWWGPDAPAVAAPAEELDLDAVQDLSQEDPAAADAPGATDVEPAVQDAAALDEDAAN